MIFGVLFSKPDSVQNPFAIFCIFCISTLIKETKLSLKFVCVAKIKFINCKIYLFHNLFVSSNMTAINMNFSPFFYSDHRDSGFDAVAGAEPGACQGAGFQLRQQSQADRQRIRPLCKRLSGHGAARPAELHNAALDGCSAGDDPEYGPAGQSTGRLPHRCPIPLSFTAGSQYLHQLVGVYTALRHQ